MLDNDFSVIQLQPVILPACTDAWITFFLFLNIMYFLMESLVFKEKPQFEVSPVKKITFCWTIS